MVGFIYIKYVITDNGLSGNFGIKDVIIDNGSAAAAPLGWTAFRSSPRSPTWRG
jgi:hypothetical protein